MLSQTQIVGIYREPFKLGSPEVKVWKQNKSVLDIVADFDSLPDDFIDFGEVCVDGVSIPLEKWDSMYPCSRDKTVHVTFHYQLQGGGGSSEKQIISIVAALAIGVFTFGVGTGAILAAQGAATGAAFGLSAAAGSAILGASIGLAGSLLLSALAPPPSRPDFRRAGDDGSGTSALKKASLSGNTLEPNSPIPRVIGTRRIFPPFAYEPIIEVIGQEEVAQSALILAGAHKIEDIRIGTASINDLQQNNDVKITVFDGLSGSNKIEIPKRQGRTFPLNLEMSIHGTDPEDESRFNPPLPVFHSMTTADKPDEAWLHLALGGLLLQSSPTALLRIPFRIRMRRKGDATWRELPEIHYMDNTQAQKKLQIKFLFEPLSKPLPAPLSDRGFVEARTLVPGQNVEPVGSDFKSDSYFSNSTGFLVAVATSGVGDRVMSSVDGSVWAEAPAASDRNWTSVTFAPKLSLFAAVANSGTGNRVMTSPDNVNWTARTTPVDNAWSSVTWSPELSLFVAVATTGTGNRVMTSPDGIAWTARTTPVDNAWSSVVWSGSIGTIYRSNTVNSTTVDNVTLEPEIVTFYLDPAEWPSGRYDIEIKRGSAFLNSTFNSNNYTSGGTIFDMFGSTQSGTLPLSRNGLLDRISLTRLISIRNITPINQTTNTLIHITARNRALDRISVLASGYVRNWNGVDWNTVETTSNPAAHFRDVMVGSLNFDPIPEDLLDLDSIQEWHDKCALENHTCDMTVESSGISEVLRLIASCGFASPYQSEKWGVVEDYDRSAETPIQMFTPRNSNNLSWKKALPRLPAGFRVNYSDIDFEYEPRQVSVRRPNIPDNDARMEQVTYDGIVHQDKVIKRAKFDLKQGEFRSAIYSLTASADALRCRKGSLVGVNHDLLVKLKGSARIKNVFLNQAGLIDGLELDTDVRVENHEDFLTATNLKVETVNSLGIKTGVTIRRTNGLLTTHETINATSNTDIVWFKTPFADDITNGSFYDKGNIKQVSTGCLIAIGELKNVQKRYIVTEIENGKGLSANLTLVDEAPELWSE